MFPSFLFTMLMRRRLLPLHGLAATMTVLSNVWDQAA